MRERVIVSQPEILVANSIHIPYDKIHQLTLWMRRIAAEFEGVPIPE
jgi:hypothetical protein